MKWHEANECPADGETVLVYHKTGFEWSGTDFDRYFYKDGCLQQEDCFYCWDMVIKWCNFAEAMKYLLESDNGKSKF